MHPAPDTSKFSHLTEEEMKVVISEKQSPLEGTAITEGILSALLVIFLVNHVGIVLTSAWTMFTKPATITEGNLHKYF